MEHVVRGAGGGRVREIAAVEGARSVRGRAARLHRARGLAGEDGPSQAAEVDLDHIRPDLAEALDAAPDMGSTRPGPRRWPAGTAAQPHRPREHRRPGRSGQVHRVRRAWPSPPSAGAARLEDLIARTPADGLISGIGAVNGDLFGESAPRCAVLAYDYTVLAGTQGSMNHRKTDRLFELVERSACRWCWFAEGGGGRPGDTDGVGGTGLDCPTFRPSPR